MSKSNRKYSMFNDFCKPEVSCGCKGNCTCRRDMSPNITHFPVPEMVGPEGPQGLEGKSAYQVWLEEGNTGTIQDFLDSLVGDTGPQGDVGPMGPQGDQGAQGLPGQDGTDGVDGNNGWTAVTAIVSRDDDEVEQIIDWVGGEGTKPPVNQYIGETGWVTDINLAKNIRGAQGQSGSGTGDMLASLYDPNGSQTDVYDRANHTGTQAISTISGLQTQIDGKYNNPAGTTSQYIRGDGTLATFPTITSGTVTSVGLSTPTGFSVTNTPVTSSGNLVLGFAAGYSLPTNAKQATWDAKEPSIAAGTTAQYWRGDKTWAALNKFSVGLDNVDNTSDLNKPISTATASALNAKQDALVSGTTIKTINGTSILGSGNIVTPNDDTTYTAGSGITLTGTEFSVPVSVTGTGSYVQTVTQTASGIAVTLGTPAGTTYSLMTAAELNTGTATTARTISAERLNTWLNAKNYLTEVAWDDVTDKPSTFTPSAHTHNASDINAGVLADARIPSLNASKINAGTFGIARIPTGTTASTVAIGNDSRILNGQTAFGWGNHATEGYLKSVVGSDLGLAANNVIPVWSGTDWISNGRAVFEGPGATTVVIRNSGGRGRFNDAVNNDEAVTLGQLNAQGYLQSQRYKAVTAVAANRTIALVDEDCLWIVSGTRTLTVPTNTSVAFPIGGRIDVQVNAGATADINGASGVALTHKDGTGNTSREGFTMFTFIKTAANAWTIVGG